MDDERLCMYLATMCGRGSDTHFCISLVNDAREHMQAHKEL